MSQTDTTDKVNSYVGYAISLASGVISTALAALAIGIVVKNYPLDSQDGKLFTIFLGVIIPFVLFFGAIALRGLNPHVENRKELMSINGWRILATLLLMNGIVAAIYGHWFALVLPGVMALICMMKDRWFIEKLRSIGYLP